MNIKTYYCPQCGSSLQADENTIFINCSNCGYGFNVLSNTKRFVSDDGVLLGTAIVPDNYEISGDYEALWRSEMVPIYYSVKAFPERDLIKVNSPFLFNQIYVNKEDFDFVLDYINSHVKK